MKFTPLHSQHVSLFAKMGEFAGYDMPLYYGLGVLKEHEWVRSSVGIFDVSHMGQVSLKGVGTQKFLESITPSSFEKLGVNRTKYSVLINDKGGVVDDVMVTKTGDDEFHLVINAGCKDKDIAWIESKLPEGIEFKHFDDWALIALQGVHAESVMRDVLGIDLSDLPYMGYRFLNPRMIITRLGYTGEDGFEISVPNDDASVLWDKLLSDERVRPIGLAARDSLRLEMGYCLYGHELNEDIQPLEADLAWIMPKDAIARYPQPTRKRVGVVLTDKGIARENSDIVNKSGEKIGILTSGGYSPSLKQSIGMGYVLLDYAIEGTEIAVVVRGNPIAAKITKLPFLKPKTRTGK